MVYNFLKDVPGIGPMLKLGVEMKAQTLDANDLIQDRRKRDSLLPVKAVELLQSGHELPDAERLSLWSDFERFPVTEDAQEFGQRIAERILGSDATSNLRNTDEELIDYMMDRDFLSLTERPSDNRDTELRRRSRIIGVLRVVESALRAKGISNEESLERTLRFFDRSGMSRVEEGNVADRAAWLQAFIFGYAEAWNHPLEGIIDDESPLYQRVQQMVQAFCTLDSVSYKQQATIVRRMGLNTREVSGFDKFSGIPVSSEFMMQDVQNVRGVDQGFEVFRSIMNQLR